MKRKAVSILMTMAMGMALLTGCGSTADTADSASSDSSASAETTAAADTTAQDTEDISGEVNIVHYFSEPPKIEALNDMVAGFEKEYPGVKVNLESTTLENYQDVLKLKFSTGDVPDILLGSCKTYSNFVESGNIEDITNEDFMKNIDESLLPMVSIDNKVYSVPLCLMPNGVMYNKDIFKEVGVEVPTTYSEFIDVCKKLKAAGYDAAAAGYQDGISVGANFYTIFYGAPYLKCDHYVDEMVSGEKKAEDYPSLKQAMEQWREIQQYQNQDNRTINTDRAEQIFANHEAGMLLIGSWGVGAVQNYDPDGNYGAFMYPSEENAADNAVPLASGDTWMMVKDSPNHAAAVKFMEYMTRPDVNSQYCAKTQQISAIKGADVSGLPAAMQDFYNMIQNGKVAPYEAVNSFSGQYFTTWGESLQDYIQTEDMTFDAFCEEVDNGFAAANK